jgi:hypothetical protein
MGMFTDAVEATFALIPAVIASRACLVCVEGANMELGW